MIKRTIEVSAQPAHLTVRHQQLLIQHQGETLGAVPCEDLGVVVVDHPGASYSHAALAAILDSEAVLVVCGRDHLPLGVLLPLGQHSEIVWRIDEQVSAGAPLRKRLWQQIVQAKIRAQADNLRRGSVPHRRLTRLAREVRSGDPMNCEAQAARVYWSAWLLTADDEPPELPFRRDPDGDGLNPLLNYGYAIVRAAVARALVAAGLLPAIGIHHSNRSNAFCLADDLIEPLRPMVDRKVRELFWSGVTELDRPAKQSLLELLADPVVQAGERGPLMVALHRMAASLVRCFQGTGKNLEVPVSCRSADTVACGS
ncbi:MAG: type II CRISPR-associated endonuclease Cas1 [Planctomycetales bacterium]